MHTLGLGLGIFNRSLHTAEPSIELTKTALPKTPQSNDH